MRAARRCLGRGEATRGDHGSVSVELALALPSVVIVLGLVLAGAAWVRDDIAASHAATTVARIALTDTDAAAAASGERISGGEVSIVRDGGWIVARVTVAGVGPLPDAQGVARVPSYP